MTEKDREEARFELVIREIPNLDIPTCEQINLAREKLRILAPIVQFENMQVPEQSLIGVLVPSV